MARRTLLALGLPPLVLVLRLRTKRLVRGTIAVDVMAMSRFVADEMPGLWLEQARVAVFADQ